MQNLVSGHFAFTTEQYEILLLLEPTGSLSETAARLGRDISVISRQLTQIAKISADRGYASPIEKINGRWRVSSVGRNLNQWARDAIQAQAILLKNQVSVRIITTREFGARILGPGLKEILGSLPDRQIQVLTSEDGVERSILSGRADIGLDCGTPRDPAIRFKRVSPEPFVVVAAPGFWKRPLSMEQLLKLPHLGYTRMSTARSLKLGWEGLRAIAEFNDLASLRGAGVSGLGWAIMPRYTIRQELDSGALRELRVRDLPRIEPESFGVWWQRDRTSLSREIGVLMEWLRRQEL